MATIVIPLVVCIVGALLWFVASNPKLSEAGRLAFFVGLFWCVYLTAGRTLHL
jgi:hypothetical protein